MLKIDVRMFEQASLLNDHAVLCSKIKCRMQNLKPKYLVESTENAL
jgi:hypothetical protein